MDDKIRKIDACWEEVKPKSWGKNAQSSERQMLHLFLDRDELPESMVKGIFIPEEPRSKDLFVSGIVVATNMRLVAVGAGGIQRSPTCTTVEYKEISAAAHESGLLSASIRISGPAMRTHRINGIRDKKSVEPFVEHLLAQVAAHDAKEEAELSESASDISDDVSD